MSEYKPPICRGSLVFGNGCGKCEKCRDEREKTSFPLSGGAKGVQQYLESEGLAPTANSEMSRMHRLSVEQGKQIANLTVQIEQVTRERDALRGAIKKHNNACNTLCDVRPACEAYTSRGLQCPRCSKDWQIDIPDDTPKTGFQLAMEASADKMTTVRNAGKRWKTSATSPKDSVITGRTHGGREY